MKKLKFLGPLAVVIVGVGLVLFWYLGKGEASKQGYKIETLKKGKIQAIVTSTGSVTPINTVKVGSQVSGNLMEIDADYNSVVTKGQILARIDPAIYSAQAAQTRALLLRAKAQILQNQRDIEAAVAGVTSAKAGIASAKASLHEAELSYDRLSKLAERQIISKQTLTPSSPRRKTRPPLWKWRTPNWRRPSPRSTGSKPPKRGWKPRCPNARRPSTWTRFG